MALLCLETDDKEAFEKHYLRSPGTEKTLGAVFRLKKSHVNLIGDVGAWDEGDIEWTSGQGKEKERADDQGKLTLHFV